MAQKRLLKLLQSLGLDDKEAQVYLASLSLGPASVLDIARAAQLQRTTVYSMVDTLQHKGLMSVEVKGFKNKFVAEDPRALKGIIAAKTESLADALPELDALYNLKGQNSLIKYYNGLDGLKVAYRKMLDSLRPNDIYMAIGDTEKFIALDPPYVHAFLNERATRCRGKVLLVGNPEGKDYQQRNYPNTEVKLLPPHLTFNTSEIIIPTQVIFPHVTPPVVTTVVENQKIVDAQRQMFELIWASLPSPDLAHPGSNQ